MSKSPKLRIGLVLNYKKSERKKEELIPINSSKMEWLILAKDEKYEPYVISIKKSSRVKKYIPSDAAVGIYLEYYYKNVSVDYITPDEISLKRFKQNDIVFVLIYDLLECFHLSDIKIFNKYKNVLKKSNNVYPPYLYQKFVNNKCDYYRYLEEKGIPIAPTFCITKEKWYSKDPKHYVEYLMKKIKKRNWDSVIVKPVYGQEAIGFKKFMNIKSKITQLSEYLAKNVSKYKSIVFQEYIPDFDKNKPEIRTYFVNGKYKYSIITDSNGGHVPKQEGGKYSLKDKDYIYVKKFAKKVMNHLPKIIINKNEFPILTRIDIGSGLPDVPFEYFVNEIEFVPSLYIEETKYPIIEDIADALLKTSKQYKDILDHNQKVNTFF